MFTVFLLLQLEGGAQHGGELPFLFINVFIYSLYIPSVAPSQFHLHTAPLPLPPSLLH